MIRTNKTAKLWLRVVSLVMALLLLCSGSVFAADLDEVPYFSYCYWEGPSRNTAVPMRAMYEVITQINSNTLGIYAAAQEDNSIAEAITPEHLALSPDMSELFVVDSPNSRILVLDTSTYELKRIINEIPLSVEMYGVLAHQTVTLKANTDYVVSWYSQRDSGTNAYSVTLWDGEAPIAVEGGNVFDHTNYDWVEHTITFNTGAATDVRVQFNSETDESTGNFYVESMVLYEAADADKNNLLVDGGFDAEGLPDWNIGLGGSVGGMVRDQTNGSLLLSNALYYENAQGVTVVEDGRMFISDTKNARVLVVGSDGSLQHIIGRPQGIEIPEDLVYAPVNVIVDDKGYLYVAAGEACYHGLLVFDDKYNFKGFHGSYQASADLLDTLTGMIDNLFMTNEKSDSGHKDLPPGVIQIAMDPDGFLYALSDTKSNMGQIKRMGLNGSQTLNFKSGFTTQSGDLLNFVEQPKKYYPKGNSFGIQCNLYDLAVDPQGFIYGLDTIRGRVFVFDEECRTLCAFGLGFNEGIQVGTYETPSGIAVSDNKLFVSDSKTSNITVYELTEYGAIYKEADTLTINGEYEKALPLWEQIVKLDANNQRSYEGLAKAYLARKDYQNAMKYAELGNDQQTYALAFTEVQKAWLSTNFWWIFIVSLLAVGAIAAVLVISKKRKIFEIKNANLRTALSVPFHPFQAFQSMKVQKNISVGLAVLFVVIFYLARVSQDLYGGFMYVIVDKTSYNSLFTLFGSVGILLLWVITNWGICMLNDGKGSLKEVFAMSAYSMAPMIAYSLIFTVGSHIIPATSTDSFAIIGTILTIYMVLLLLIGMTVIHEYTFFKAMGMTVVTILCMALAVFVICSVVLLSQQFIVFIVSVINEIRLR